MPQTAIWVRVWNPQFVEDVLDMGLDGVLRDVERRGNLAIREALADGR